MVLDDIWTLFREQVFPKRSTAVLFNQYLDVDPALELPQGAAIHRENLRRYLFSFERRPSLLIVGEAPGWRGCRYSGVPFSSERQLCQGGLPFGGDRSSLGAAPYAESSATLFWRQMRPYHGRFLVWNAIPFHPHRPGQSHSNRAPTGKEIAAHSDGLQRLVSLLEPEQVVALGRSAERALRRIGIGATYVRHPSHGGAAKFKVGIQNILCSDN